MRESRDRTSTKVFVDESTATPRIRLALEQGSPAGIRDSVDGLNAAQLADALEALSSAQCDRLWAQIDSSRKGKLHPCRRNRRGGPIECLLLMTPNSATDP